jgi:hypothetical protein
MKKNLFYVLVCLPLLATACPTVTTVPSIGVPCSNNLDASSFGFTLTIPADFTCTTVESNPSLLVSTRYRQNSTGYIAAVNLAPPGTVDGCGGEPTCNELENFTTGGITFRVFRVAAANPGFITYLAITTLSSGNNLGISISTLSTNDDPALRSILSAILQTVQLT